MLTDYFLSFFEIGVCVCVCVCVCFLAIWLALASKGAFLVV